jgi:hypothetical protein
MTYKQVRAVARDYIKQSTDLASVSRFMGERAYNRSQELLIKEYATKMDPMTDDTIQILRDVYGTIELECVIDKDGRDIMSNGLYEKLLSTI